MPGDPAAAAGGPSAGSAGDIQVWLLPMDGGEATQLTRLPEDVTELAWSPDGTRLCVVSAPSRPTGSLGRARARRRRRPATCGSSTGCQYQLNGVGFIYDREPNLWIVDVASGEPRRLTSGISHDTSPPGARTERASRS